MVDAFSRSCDSFGYFLCSGPDVGHRAFFGRNHHFFKSKKCLRVFLHPLILVPLFPSFLAIPHSVLFFWSTNLNVSERFVSTVLPDHCVLRFYSLSVAPTSPSTSFFWELRLPLICIFFACVLYFLRAPTSEQKVPLIS